MIVKEFKRNCPTCKRELVYSSYNSWFSSKNKMGCNSCSRIGHKHSDETKIKIGKANKIALFGKKLSNITKLKMSLVRKGIKLSNETKNKISSSSKGRKMPVSHRINMSIIITKRYTDPNERKKTSKLVKEAMHRPDIRKKHMEALHHSKWIKVKTDKGQLELLEKWNKLGFNFEPNYQIHTDTDLFYIDGYDKDKKVILEYDGKYHNKSHQKKKDIIRQQKIIDILKPKKFWRYDAINKQCKDVLESVG